MVYRENQLIQTNTDNKFEIIDKKLSVVSTMLPDGLEFKTLGTRHLDEIHKLISNHYVENNIVRLIYSRDFLYWYLSYIPTGFVIGLVLGKKLVGVVTAMFIQMTAYGNIIDNMPYINFLCVHSKIRQLGLGNLLLDEMSNRLVKNNIKCALFCTQQNLSNAFCTTVDFVVPINYPKLIKIGFLQEDLEPLPDIKNNYLHLTTVFDIDIIVAKLNNYLSNFKVATKFTSESATHLLMPKKDIVYSFIKKNDTGIVTDFVSVYQFYYYCMSEKELVKIAQLAYYFNETMSLTNLIHHLINKLAKYGFDQLIFKNNAQNININITKFATTGQSNYAFYNINTMTINASDMCLLPI